MCCILPPSSCFCSPSAGNPPKTTLRGNLNTRAPKHATWPLGVKPLYQARESSLVPDCLLTVHFLQKRRFMKPLLLSSVAIFIDNTGCLFFNRHDTMQCLKKKFSVQFSHPSTKTLLQILINLVKWTQVPVCKLNTYNWHRIQFGLIHYIKVMKVDK